MDSQVDVRNCAPEAFFHDPIGLPADIWSYGCTVFNIFSDGHLFANDDADDPEKVLLDMVQALGILPSRWWQQWLGRDDYFWGDGTPGTFCTNYGDDWLSRCKLLLQRIQQGRSKQRSEQAIPFPPSQIQNLQALLSKTLKYLPSERATAEELSTMQGLGPTLKG